jgi:hypothetical protein
VLLLRRLGLADQRRRRGRRYGASTQTPRPRGGTRRPGRLRRRSSGHHTPPPTSKGTPATLSALQTHKQTPPTANPGRAAGGCALALRTQRRRPRRKVCQWRATETVHSQPGGAAAATLWPSWSPVVRSAGSAAAQLANMGSVDDPAHPVNRGCVPKPHPAIGEPARGAPTGGPQPAQGRELVIVDLGHATITPPSWPGHRAAALAGVARDSIHL